FFIFQSCKKDKVTVPTYPITGLWIGTYNIIEAIESGEDFYYSFYIRRDDSIQVQGVGADGHTYYGIGTWTLTDSTLQATFTTTNSGQQGVIQNATAIYDEKKGVLKDGIVETPGQFFKASFKLSRTN
ncbi:MAG TPA: hypothetical protein VM101_10155, partial [Flavitalea sp.]|nr:hypothetical protein [Flavitalea sp.]